MNHLTRSAAFAAFGLSFFALPALALGVGVGGGGGVGLGGGGGMGVGTSTGVGVNTPGIGVGASSHSSVGTSETIDAPTVDTDARANTDTGVDTGSSANTDTAARASTHTRHHARVKSNTTAHTGEGWSHAPGTLNGNVTTRTGASVSGSNPATATNPGGSPDIDSRANAVLDR